MILLSKRADNGNEEAEALTRELKEKSTEFEDLETQFDETIAEVASLQREVRAERERLKKAFQL